jgi:hypothetical protein
MLVRALLVSNALQLNRYATNFVYTTNPDKEGGMNEINRLEPADAPDLWPEIEIGLASDGEFAVREHLAAGFPVYYSEFDTPAGLLVKEHPDGRRELVRHNRKADQIIRLL